MSTVGHTCGTASSRSSVLVVVPGVTSWFAFAGNGKGPPDFFLALQVGSRNPAPDAVLGAGNAGDCHVLHNQGRTGDDFALVGIGNLSLPGDLTGVLIGCDQPAVKRVGNDDTSPHRAAAI